MTSCPVGEKVGPPAGGEGGESRRQTALRVWADLPKGRRWQGPSRVGSEPTGHVGVTVSMTCRLGVLCGHLEWGLAAWQASRFTGEGDSPSPRAQGKVPAGSRGAGQGTTEGPGPVWVASTTVPQAIWRHGHGADPAWGWSQLSCSNPLTFLDFTGALAPKFTLLYFDQLHPWYPPAAESGPTGLTSLGTRGGPGERVIAKCMCTGPRAPEGLFPGIRLLVSEMGLGTLPRED